MNGAKKNLLAAGGVIVVISALMTGSILRERAEAGPDILQQPNRSSMFASLDEDPTVPESDFFWQLSQLVKREYVDSVTDDDKLAEGAVRGMITGLGDPSAEFLKKDQFQAFKNLQRGQFEGIGVEIQLQYDDEQKKWLKDLDPLRANPAAESPITTPGVLIPGVVVTAVAPGGPADRAGIQIGDRIVMIDGKKVLDSQIFRKFQDLQRKVRKGEAKAADLTSLRKELSEDAKNAMTPIHAREKAVTGTSGDIRVGWLGATGMKEASLTKHVVEVPAVATKDDGVIHLRMFEGAATSLVQVLKDRPTATIDLRNSTLGSFEAMLEVLEAVAKPGTLGEIKVERQAKPKPLAIKTGDATPTQFTLLVDRSTRGAAEIFALALAANGQAKLSGKTSGEPVDIQVVELPTGAGYLLPVGKYAPLGKEKAS